MPYPFIEARYYTRGRQGPIDVVVVHAMEAAERHDTAEAVARWFAGPDSARASAHYCVDDDSIVQCVRDGDVAWHAPGSNHDGIGVELAGRSAQSSAEWRDEYSSAVLVRAAGLVAAKCVRYGIPAVWLYPADLLADRRGITSHWNVTLAFRRSDHTDPGPGFPSQWFVALVRRRLAQGVRRNGGRDEPWALPPGRQLKDPPPTLAAGDVGWRVRRLQRLLAARGAAVDVTDEFDGPTFQAVLELQSAEGFEPDGIAGPETWRALVNGVAELQLGRIYGPSHATQRARSGPASSVRRLVR